MAKPIAPTPTLKGDEVKEFLKDMERPDTPEELLVKERIGNTHRVRFL